MWTWLRRVWWALRGGKSAGISREAREGRYEAEQDIARSGGGYWRR
jgi:hypothetical protein